MEDGMTGGKAQKKEDWVIEGLDEPRGGESKGRSEGREFTGEATGIRCGEREGRQSAFMEECGRSQCGRWDGEIKLPGVGERWEEDKSRQLSSPPRTQRRAAWWEVFAHSDWCSFRKGKQNEGKLPLPGGLRRRRKFGDIETNRPAVQIFTVSTHSVGASFLLTLCGLKDSCIIIVVIIETKWCPLHFKVNISVLQDTVAVNNTPLFFHSL